MRLEDIGFYTLSDRRARTATSASQMGRGELILTGRCNFKCPYCRPVRGLRPGDPRSCALVLDDMAIMGERHYPCIIYLREDGKSIGKVGPKMRKERGRWFREHDSYSDPICQRNCLDVCVDYNQRCIDFERLDGMERR